MRLARLSRSPLTFWVAVAALALLTASVVAGAVGRAQSLAARYGPLRPVVVAARAADRGATLTADHVTVRRVPASFRPDGAFAGVEAVEGRTVVVPLLAGQPVLPGHLAPDGLVGVAALMPPRARAVAVPAGTAAPSLRVGDVVDVLATFADEGARAVAVGAGVVEVGEESATLAVSPVEARAVAFALAHGSVILALAPPPLSGSG